MDEKALAKELKIVFMQEAKERLNSIINCLIEIDQKEDDSEKQQLTETVFRDMHSMKGAARSINLSHFEAFFQILETFLSEIKTGSKTLTPEASDLIQESMNKLDSILLEDNLESLDNDREISEIKKFFTENLEKLNHNSQQNSSEPKPVKPAKQKPPAEVPDKEPEPPVQEKTQKEKKPEEKGETSQEEKVTEETQKAVSTGSETVRITSGKLDSLLLKSENLIKIKQMFQENSNSINKILSQAEILRNSYTKTQADLIFLKQHLKATKNHDRRENRKPIKSLVDFFDGLETNLSNLDTSLRILGNIEKENFRTSEKMIDNFLFDIKDVAMLPFSNILSVFPRMVKDISKELKKTVNFEISGDDNQIDRRILQEMKDPLIHLVRNCIDHGIETTEVRQKAGKSEKGNIKLSITQSESNKIEILIKDDGKGIDENAIKKKLLSEGQINDDTAAKLTKEELIDHIFFSGFSTKEIITDISGRGLGLAIAKERLEKLGGKIEIASEPKKGTEIKLILPVALSTFKGVLVEINKQFFAIPSINVEKVIRVLDPVIKKIENRESVVYHDTTYPLVNLASILQLEIPSKEEKEEETDNALTAVIVEKNNKYMALQIDDIIEEQEILVKDLGSQLKKVENISGATILNSGEIVPILNVQDLFFTAQNINYVRTDIKKKTDDSEKTEEKARGANNILLAEDSITSRILLKNILESAGYNVDAAVDGVAAMTVLRTKKIDLVVSDIEMPRMDGFTLTGKIKADSKLSDIPVILVTSLSSDEDKERGIEAGANAYIMKSQFDQSNLLNTIESLI